MQHEEEGSLDMTCYRERIIVMTKTGGIVEAENRRGRKKLTMIDKVE